jgi:hypothetical protein
LQSVLNDPFYLELLNGKRKRVRELVQLNQNMLDKLIPFRPEAAMDQPTSQLNKVKLMSTVKQFYREWS